MPVGRIEIDREMCKGCELCIPVCPTKVIALEDAYNKYGVHPAFPAHNDKCTGCQLCSMMCPDTAISVWRERKAG